MRNDEFYWGLVYGGAAGVGFAILASVLVLCITLFIDFITPGRPASYYDKIIEPSLIAFFITFVPSVGVGVIVGGLIGAREGKRKETHSGDKTLV